MDYIVRLLDRKLEYFKILGETRNEAEYWRVKIEYGLIFVMSYLWSKNIDKLDVDTKEYVFEKINMPSIGSIVDISRKLDLQKEIFINKKFNEAINSYPKLRNERVGHGYTFEDGLDDYLTNLAKMCSLIFNSSPILTAHYDLIIVLNYGGGMYKGMSYKSDGTSFVPWACSDKVSQFEIGKVYALTSTSYHKISPFVFLTTDDEFYLFKNIEENLTGKIRYNRLLKTGTTAYEWKELTNISLENSEFRRKSVNGTIISVIDKNYKRYIEVGALKKKIINFLLKDKASVCATVWGHGGVGKTATVQSICEDLANEQRKQFDYIVFASAKDRYYNYYTGTIEAIQENIDTFDGLIKSINRAMFGVDSSELEEIINTESKILIVIDDYETFPGEEKQKIENFIRALDINYHKVLVTTRANLIIGDEFQINELDPEETKSFLMEVLRSEFDNYRTHSYEDSLVNEEKYKLVHDVTSGRPLFVYQFAYLWLQMGKLDDTFTRNIRQEKTAIEFLYGRIYEYLSPVAKDIFVAIGQIVTDDDPTNLIEKVRYILNLEHSEKFDAGITELEKLRIIEIIESKFFRVYSREILHIMTSYFSKRNDSYRRSVTSRMIEVTKDKKLDNERALLYNANAARTSRNEEEVVRLYRSIMNRESSPLEVKLQALFNLGEYLFNIRGKRDETVKIFKDYEHLFYLEPSYSRMFAIYLWATGRKEESIRGLLDLFAKKTRSSFDDKNLRLELLGLLLMYRGLDAIQQREDLKEKIRFNEIDQQSFNREYEKTKVLFADICNHQGKLLFNEIKQIQSTSALSSAARQNVIAGLYQYVNLSIRLRKYEEAILICEYVIDSFPVHFHEQFKSKQAFCTRNIRNFKRNR
ncbi:MAG: NB-ARC domain-containing protein [Caldilineaceae bacterium]